MCHWLCQWSLVGFDDGLTKLNELTFGCENPLPLWRKGIVSRTGFLSPDESEYSLHGHGCTVEKNGRLISFDFDKDGNYCYSVFKFMLFDDNEALGSEFVVEEFKRMLVNGVLVKIPGHGVRLAQH